MVITGLRLFCEAYCSSLTVHFSISLNERSHRLMHHVAVQAAENLSASNGGAGKHVHRRDEAIRDGAQVRGMLLIQRNQACDGERTRRALDQYKC